MSCTVSRSRDQTEGRHSGKPLLHLHSDCPPEPSEESPSLKQRSVSLTTLQSSVTQPRMAQLQNLEAKMASIEVSLSNTPKRKKGSSVSAISLGSSIKPIPKEIAVKELEMLRNALKDKENVIQNLKGQLAISSLHYANMRNNSLCNNINRGNLIGRRDFGDIDKKIAEKKLNKLKSDTENKRLAIKNLEIALERLDITDNIDVRIQQAELEYQLGREELNLLTLLEETRALQLCLAESDKNFLHSSTLYGCITDNENVSLQAIEILYDPRSPKFGANQMDSTPGLWIEWTLDDTGLCKGDRLIEVNGKVVLTKTKDDLTRLLAAAPDPAQLVVLRKQIGQSITNGAPISSNNSSIEVATLRSELEVVKEKAEEAQRAKDSLQSDNIRLTHRISYLEEQVSELLKHPNSDSRSINKQPTFTSTVKSNQNITNINITTDSNPVISKDTADSNDIQVFQKGPQVTALVRNLSDFDNNSDSHGSLSFRSKSSLSNISNTRISTPINQSLNIHSCYPQQNDKNNYRKNSQHYCKPKDYNSETSSTVEIVRRQNKKNIKNDYKEHNKPNLIKHNLETSVMDQNYKKVTKIVQELTRNKVKSLYEKHRQKCITASEKYNVDILKHYNARKSSSVLDFHSNNHIDAKFKDSKSVDELCNNDYISSELNKHLHKTLQESKSVNSLDFDSDFNSNDNYNKQKSVDYTSEPIGHERNSNTYYSLNGEIIKRKPAPPKKPLRLSLHSAQSLQLKETLSSTSSNHSPNRSESRKPMKRNHKGESPPARMETQRNIKDTSVSKDKLSGLKWTNFVQLK